MNATAYLVTPVGSGGIAVIEVHGRGAADVVARVLRLRSGGDGRQGPPGRLLYGHIVDGGAVIDEVIVSRGPARECIEINCHGGVAAATEILRLLVKAGAEEGTPSDAAGQLAAVAGLDTIQAEAFRLLPQAATRLAVRVLCDQLNGALSREIASIEPGTPEAPGRLQRLIDSAAFGLALIRPRRVALVGRPNAGKSSLFNALVGHNRAIVSPTAGTTRDFVNEFISLRGFPLELIDTAGLRQRGGLVEMKGAEAAWRVISDAAIVLLLLDGSSSVSRDEARMIELLLPRRPILVISKSDLPERVRAIPAGLDVCRVSALSGGGITDLENLLLGRLPDAAGFPPGAAVVFTEDQLGNMRDSKKLCDSGAWKAASELLRGMIQRSLT